MRRPRQKLEADFAPGCAYAQGRHAARAGNRRRQCPYEADCRMPTTLGLRQDWLAGFDNQTKATAKED